MRGPSNTGIAWMEYLHVSNDKGAYGSMIVQTFKENGWDVFVSPTKSGRTDQTIIDIIKLLEAK